MSAEEDIVARKFELLNITKEEFERLPVTERLDRLEDLREAYITEQSELLTRSGDLRRAIAELEDTIAGTYTTIVEFEDKARQVGTLRTAYHKAVHDERVEIGRLGAYTRLYRLYRARREFERARRYADLIVDQREKIFPLVAEVARIRAELRALPRLDRLTRRIDEMRSVVLIYERRLTEYRDVRKYTTGRLEWISKLITEISREIDELKVIPKVVRHRYRELSISITAAVEYESERRGGEAGHDIDMEVHLDFRVKSLLPTRYAENETAWLDEIQEVIRSETCGLLQSCFGDYFERYWEQILSVSGWTCNIVGRRIVRRTIINATKFYEDLVPPISKKSLITIFRRELERYCYISQITISVLRANELHGLKSRSLYAEETVRTCMDRRRDEIITSVVDWDVPQEIDELMRYLSE